MEEWQSLLSSASRLRSSGRVAEAIAAYQKLLALKPDLPDSWYNLGWLQRQARDFEGALQSYQRALQLNVAEPEEVHLNRAVIFSDHLHQPDEAERELRAALQKNRAYVPALLNLGNLHEDIGERESARNAYQQALGLDPGNHLALARLAGVSHNSDLDLALAERLRSALRARMSEGERADLAFALAGLLDAGGRYDEAFEVAQQANHTMREGAGGSARRYDRAAHERLIGRIIESFDQAVDNSGAGAAVPLFICGMFRSGSTLVERILARHSRVSAGGELDLIPAIAGTIDGYPEAAAAADRATVERWRDLYLGGLPSAPRGKRIITDKRPDNFLHIGLIKTIFPRAKIVHTRRDPLDNLVSLYFLHLDARMAYATDLADAAHWYGQYERLMAHWKTIYPGDIIDVDYDALVREPRHVVERLLIGVGLPWEEAVLDSHQAAGPVKTASVWQVRQPLHSRSSGRWRNYRKQLDPIARLMRQPDLP